ncbi:iron-containing alcohol dehydrogenase [Streptomyces sp. NPDC020951]|uniref:iron-containing alcohol dehydrogenase n=1 Tax=Streptomyces sp. NPDC020951 TaxID=3365104 RepID=UPI0037B3C837
MTGSLGERASGARSVELTALSARHEVEHFDGVRPNPGIEQIRAGIATMRRFGPQAVIGIGGGSSLDVAKSIAVLAVQRRSPEDCLRHPEVITEERRCALVLMPTTAGSGSEMTRFATVYIEGRKYSLDVDQARVDLVLVDQDLTRRHPQGSAAVRDAVADIENIAQAQTGHGIRQLTGQLLALVGRPARIEQLALPADRWLDTMTAALASGRAANNPCVLTAADVLPLLA